MLGWPVMDNHQPALTLDDLNNCGYMEAFQFDNVNYATVHLKLFEMAQKANEEGRTSHSRVLHLLAGACSMSLQPSSINNPFLPSFVMAGRRSTIPEDFSKADIEYFILILDAILEPWLKARLADLIWLRIPNRKDIALKAIDAYFALPLTTKVTFRDIEYLERGIRLANLHKVKEKIKDTLDQVIQVIGECSIDTRFLAKWLADLLDKCKLWRNEEKIAEKMEILAGDFFAHKDFFLSREYYATASSWFEKAKNYQKSYAATAYQANCFCQEAIFRENALDFITAASLFEKAIQIYRSIPKDFREDLAVEQKLHELRLKLRNAGQMAAQAMSTQFFSIDVADLVKRAQELVAGKEDPAEALKILANIYPGIDCQRIRSSVEETLSQVHLLSFFSSTTITPDGRIAAKTPGICDSNNSQKYEEVIRAEMLKSYYREIGIVACAQIIPALEAVLSEHRLQVEYFITFSNQSSIVPPNRANAFGKALYAGYDLDFESALHRLVPQLENMVRYHLKAANVITTTLDEEGIETENGLSALLKKPEASQIFGENLVFEMKALLCDGSGPNLRHLFAHGLLENGEFQSAYSIYTWYLTLRIVFNVFWNSLNRE